VTQDRHTARIAAAQRACRERREVEMSGNSGQQAALLVMVVGMLVGLAIVGGASFLFSVLR
jgi:hypothetical protein